MKQRVGIARAFAIQPKMLLLDEPFSALDALTRGSIQDELLRICAETQQTVFMITHDVDEAILLADRILLMTNGPRRADRRDRRQHDAARAARATTCTTIPTTTASATTSSSFWSIARARSARRAPQRVTTGAILLSSNRASTRWNQKARKRHPQSGRQLPRSSPCDKPREGDAR